MSTFQEFPRISSPVDTLISGDMYMYGGAQGQVLAGRHWDGMLRATEELEDMEEL